ncbi:MAG TPA: DUF3592 domain-containing protein [Candidatus Binatia bacterium]|jgi:hypothetical protein|nr:DUF3592 domain-containing protein [Candidatus Binatia bacterium]
MRKGYSFLSINAQSFWLWFGGIWLVVGAPFFSIGIYTAIQTANQQERFQQEGQVAQGMVLTKSIKSNSKNSSPQYWVTYRFTTPDGQVMKGSAQVNVEAWDRLQERGPIQVTYVPHAPQSHRVEGQDSGWVLPLIFTILGSVFTLLGGFVFLKGLSQVRRTRRLEREGMITEGTVLEIVPGNLSINDIPQWMIHYRYQDHLGRTHRGQSSLLSPEEAQAWQVGDTGTVRFDGRQPHQSAWVGKA